MARLNLKPAKIHGVRYIGDYGFSSLSAALDDQASVGGEVFVPVGTYQMPSTAISILPKSKIVGVGQSVSLLNWADVTANHGLNIPDPTVGTLLDIDIRDLGLWATQSKTGRAINHASGTRTRLERLWIEQWGGEGIYIDGGANNAYYSRISDCRIRNIKHGIYVPQNIRTWLIENTSIDYCYGGAYPTTSGTAIHLQSTYAVTLLTCCVEHFGSGIKFVGGPNNIALGCYLEAGTYGINVSNSAAYSTLMDNYGYSVTYFLRLDSAPLATVQGNRIQNGNASYGFTALGNLAGVRAFANEGQTSGGVNTPWVFGTVTTEPDMIEATYGGTGALAPRIVRGTSKCAYVEQANQPTLTAEGQTMLWRDTDDSKLYLVARVNGVDKKVELT